MKLTKINWFQLGIYIYKTKQNKTKKERKMKMTAMSEGSQLRALISRSPSV